MAYIQEGDDIKETMKGVTTKGIKEKVENPTSGGYGDDISVTMKDKNVRSAYKNKTGMSYKSDPSAYYNWVNKTYHS